VLESRAQAGVSCGALGIQRAGHDDLELPNDTNETKFDRREGQRVAHGRFRVIRAFRVIWQFRPWPARHNLEHHS
jgi:hypothetical protein